MEAARTKALKFIEHAKKRERVQDKARIQNGTRMPYGMPYLYHTYQMPLECLLIALLRSR